MAVYSISIWKLFPTLSVSVWRPKTARITVWLISFADFFISQGMFHNLGVRVSLISRWHMLLILCHALASAGYSPVAQGDATCKGQSAHVPKLEFYDESWWTLFTCRNSVTAGGGWVTRHALAISSSHDSLWSWHLFKFEVILNALSFVFCKNRLDCGQNSINVYENNRKSFSSFFCPYSLSNDFSFRT